MASPFPGMDPFLEHPALFPGFHDRMITYLACRTTNGGNRFSGSTRGSTTRKDWSPTSRAVVIDLQALFARCYENGPYRRRVPY